MREAFPWEKDDHDGAGDGHDELLAVHSVSSEGVAKESEAELSEDHTERKRALDLVPFDGRYGRLLVLKIDVSNHGYHYR